MKKVARLSPTIRTADVRKSDKKTPKKSDFRADLLAFSGWPDPSKNAHRTSAASATASVSCSTASHNTPRIPHAATSAGPKTLANSVKSSHYTTKKISERGYNGRVRNTLL